jgi:hypothetical protein
VSGQGIVVIEVALFFLQGELIAQQKEREQGVRLLDHLVPIKIQGMVI